ncbi:MAG: hypothetical protein JSW66_04350 [Phycisphaerales bacterium]|nr:MAG: hypothetical protein JSW66_04350 [Phycisphaerales bacterium]
MSTENHAENEQLEHLLRKARLPDPSPRLKERVTAEARKAWNQAAPDVPWQIPIRRLAVSAAAAVLVVWLANYSSDHVLARRAIGGLPTAGRVSGQNDIDALPEMPYGPFVRRLVSVQPRSSGFDASALNDRAEVFRRVLDEAQRSTFSQPQRGRPESHLSPDRPFAHSYS